MSPLSVTPRLWLKAAFFRFACIVLVVAIADALVLWLFPKPFPLVSILSSLIPLFVVLLIVIPMSRSNTEKRRR
jgi:hypothetical protein